MKKTVLMMIVLLSAALVGLAGCSGGAEMFALGGAAGAGLTNTMAGVRADLDAKEAELLAAQAERVKRLEASTDAAERQVLEAEIAALRKQLEITQTAQVGLDVGQKAMATDWTDPEQSAPWLLALLTAGYGVVVNKKKKSIEEVLQAVNEGVEKFKSQSDPTTAEKLYADIKERKMKAKVE